MTPVSYSDERGTLLPLIPDHHPGFCVYLAWTTGWLNEAPFFKKLFDVLFFHLFSDLQSEI